MPDLEWLVEKSQLNDLKFITGNDCMKQNIRSVNILDNPDVLKWFKQDELILTTGYVFKDNEKLQRQMIRDMKDIGCAALAIKIRRFFKAIPQALINEAQKLDFPIIELPYFYSFSEISNVVFYQIYLENNNSLEKKQDFLFQLMNQILQNESVSSVAQHISSFFNLPILLMDINCIPIVLSFPYNNKKMNDVSSEMLKTMMQELSLQSIDSNKENTVILDRRKYYLQIFHLDNQAGYFSFLHLKQNEKIDLDFFLQKILQLLTFACEQNNIFYLNYENNSAFFLHFLVHHQDSNSDEIKKLCAYYGFDYQKLWVCLTISLQNFAKDKKSSLIKELRCLIKKLSQEEMDVFICANNNLFCVYFLFPVDMHRLAATHKVKNIADKICSVFPVYMGMSACHKEIKDIRYAFQEALEALEYQQQAKNNGLGSYLHQLPLHLLNKYGENIAVILKYNILKPLLDFDAQNNTELVYTLQIYFQTNFNASKAAKLLYLHRNTMLNRLEKIKELLQTDLSDMQENYLIYLSLLSLKINS